MVLFKCWHASESLRELVKTDFWGPSSRDSDSEGLGWAMGFSFLVSIQVMLKLLV